MYKVIKDFADIQDNGYIYKVGDEYPREGVDVDKERVLELSGSENKIGVPLIEKIKKAEKPKKEEPIEKPE